MFYNNYKILYYPDDEGGGGGDPTIGGGGEEGGGEEGAGSGTGGSEGGTKDPRDEGSDILGDLTKDQTQQESIATKQLRIKKLIEERENSIGISALKVQNASTLIRAKGDRRYIEVFGKPDTGFSLTIKDSSGCNIMDEELENVKIPKRGTYKFFQDFPDITTGAAGGVTEEYYEVTITPHAGVTLGPEVLNGTPTHTLYQYPSPTLSFTSTTSASSPALSVAVSGTSSVTGEAKTRVNNNITWTLTITEDSATDGNFYVKNKSFSDIISTDTIVKKIIKREATEDLTSNTLNLKPLTTKTRSGKTSGELSTGMIVRGKVEKTKIVTNSLEVPTCRRKTNKFELNNTTGLFEGMWLYIDGTIATKVDSIDCGKNITVSDKVIIGKNESVDFKYDIGARVEEVVSQSNSEGNACVIIDRKFYIPDGVTLEFDDNDAQIVGATTFSGSGTDTVVLKNNISVLNYGTRDVTYTLNLDNLITRKPSAKNLNVEVVKNTAKTIILSNNDIDSNAKSKVPVVTNSGRHSASAVAKSVSDSGYYTPAIVYTPIAGYVGDDVIKYQLQDDDQATDLSDEKTIKITVLGVGASASGGSVAGGVSYI